MEPHTGQEPGATEGRVKGAQRRSGAEGTLDADRAPGMYRERDDIGPGSVTPAPTSTPSEKPNDSVCAIKAITPVMVDGGTRFAVSNLPPPTPRAIKLKQDAYRVSAEGGLVELPFDGPCPGGEVVPHASAMWTRTQAGLTFRFVVEGHAFIEWKPDRGEATVQLHAAGLWCNGVERMATYYLCQLHQLLTGHNVPIDQLYTASSPWRTTRIDLCTDHQGLSWSIEDSQRERWVGARVSNSYIGKKGVETLYVGTGESNCQVMLYDKSQQIRATKASEATYGHIWRANGYDPDQDVQRVEFKLQSKGLVYRDPSDSPTHVREDLRDPVWVTRPELPGQLHAFWSERKRLVKPTSTRKRRCEVDERWKAVQMASGSSPPDWRTSLAVADNAAQHRDELDTVKLVASLAGMAAREHRPGSTEPRMDLRTYLLDVVERPRLEGASLDHLEALFIELFEASNKRQAAELGEVMRIRADEHEMARSP